MKRSSVPSPRAGPLARLCAHGPELLVALGAFLLVAADLDPTGTYAWLPDGPGLTVDEMFNVEQGVRLEIGSRSLILGAVTLRELFGTAEELGPRAPIGYHLPDHPPLGRYLLGVAHDLVTAFAGPKDWPTPFVAAAARFGSAAAFALTVFLIGRFSTRRFGRAAGLSAAVGLVLMPRVFGHAHLASLETMVGLFYTATVLFVASHLRPDLTGKEKGNGVPIRAAVFGGFLWGLALLTKVQAVLLPVPIAVWLFWHCRHRAILPLAIFGTVGGAIFFAGWPWLWFDPVEHVLGYLGRTTNRISLPDWYLGRVFADRDVPWHYPFVTFAVTVPIGLHLLGLVGTFAGDPPGWKDSASQLVLACLAFPLLVFAFPGVAVYDGERLFLVSYPLWAVLVGKGGGIVWERVRKRYPARVATIVLTALLIAQVPGIVASRPTYLSYYNLLVGGLPGANRLGFELDYWGDSQTAALLDAAAATVPEGGTLAVAPVLHQFQLDDLRSQSPALRERGVRLTESRDGDSADALLIFHRRASLPEDLERRLEAQEPVAAVRRRGVTLAGVYLPPPPLPGQSR